MRAAVVTAMNGPWEVQNVPEPKPGPNQVLVKMHASGVCYTDVHETLGHLPGAFPRLAIGVINGGPLLREWVDDARAPPQDLDTLVIPDEQAWLSQRQGYLCY
jgi:hypothetical protein